MAIEQGERIKIAESVLADENIVLGIGDRWGDNQLHLILGCKSVIVKGNIKDILNLSKNILNECEVQIRELMRKYGINKI